MSKWLIVGADRGIGRAMSEQLAARGDSVIAACFGEGEGVQGKRNITVLPGVDVTCDKAVAKMATHLAKEKVALDYFVHVAGVLGLDELGKIDLDDVRRQIEVNTLGPLRTIQSVLNLLAPAAKIGIVTSRVGSLGDNSSGGMYAYRVSKCAANMVGLNLHHDLSKRGIAVLMLHPGMVATELTKNFPGDFKYIQPDEAAAGLIRNMDHLTLSTSGKFQHSNGEYLPW
jgi:NAD(P)-dependent dehydrogenase (short-subunit alcohol dehydrogenase family)